MTAESGAISTAEFSRLARFRRTTSRWVTPWSNDCSEIAKPTTEIVGPSLLRILLQEPSYLQMNPDLYAVASERVHLDSEFTSLFPCAAIHFVHI